MEAKWVTVDTAVEDFTPQHFYDWMKRCIGSVIDQYNYQVNKGGFVTSRYWQCGNFSSCKQSNFDYAGFLQCTYKCQLIQYTTGSSVPFRFQHIENENMDYLLWRLYLFFIPINKPFKKTRGEKFLFKRRKVFRPSPQIIRVDTPAKCQIELISRIGLFSS